MEKQCRVNSSATKHESFGSGLLDKGVKPSIRRKRYKVQPNDLVKYNSKEHCVKGAHCKGARVMLFDLVKNFSVNIKNVELICYGKGIFN